MAPPGVIYARGYSQMVEYFDDPAATSATVDAAGWLHTGDLAAKDARGMIILASRPAHMIPMPDPRTCTEARTANVTPKSDPPT